MVDFPLSIFLALGIATASFAYNIFIQRRTKNEIARLQAQLRELQQAQPTHPTINIAALKLHYKIFQRTPEYDELMGLKYLHDQFVSPRNRDRLMQAVENAYKDELTSLRTIGPELTTEDCFLCMMSMMKFSTHDIAACLGVSDDAIRKRRSRIRQKLNNSVDLFAISLA